MAKVKKLNGSDDTWARSLKSGDLLLLGDELCVRTDMDYNAEGAVVGIESGSTYYLGECESEFTQVKTGDSFQFVQE